MSRRINDEIARRLESLGSTEERELMVRYVDEVAEDHFREWLADRIAEEVREDAMEIQEP